MWLELAFVVGFLFWKRQLANTEKPNLTADYHPLYGQPGKVDKYQGHRLETDWPQRTHPEIHKFETNSIVNTPAYAQRYVDNKYDVVFENKNIFLDDTYVNLSHRPKQRQIAGYIP